MLFISSFVLIFVVSFVSFLFFFKNEMYTEIEFSIVVWSHVFSLENITIHRFCLHSQVDASVICHCVSVFFSFRINIDIVQWLLFVISREEQKKKKCTNICFQGQTIRCLKSTTCMHCIVDPRQNCTDPDTHTHTQSIQ